MGHPRLPGGTGALPSVGCRAGSGSPWIPAPPPPRAPVPAGADLLEPDERLRGDVQLVDDGVDDVGVVLHLHFHVVAVTVRDGKKHPLPDVENLPVCGAKRLGW